MSYIIMLLMMKLYNPYSTLGRQREEIAVPLSQSQPTKSSKGKNRTLSTSRKQPDPETLIPTAEQIDVEILDDATQVSIALAKSAEEYSFLLEDLEAVPADYVPAGHVLISADRYRIC
ncbi:hypothetical protein Tco_1520107 [Tanacetum coccineum]